MDSGYLSSVDVRVVFRHFCFEVKGQDDEAPRPSCILRPIQFKVSISELLGTSVCIVSEPDIIVDMNEPLHEVR